MTTTPCFGWLRSAGEYVRALLRSTINRGSAFAIEHFVAQLIGAFVLLSPHVANRHGAIEAPTQGARLFVQAAQFLIFDPILAVHLFDHQFAVAVDDDAMVRPHLEGAF